jgi:hypothetical protein
MGWNIIYRDPPQGSDTPRVPLTGAFLLAGAASILSLSGTAPKVIETDIVAGPITGGENGNGIYINLYGYNFGTTLGTDTKVYAQFSGTWHEVAGYIEMANCACYAKVPVKKICVEIGAISGATNGDTLNLKVTVNGTDSNTDKTFMIAPGDIYYVDPTSGNESTGAKNDITKPYLYPQVWTGSAFTGIWAPGNLKAGDFIVLRDGSYSGTNGFDSRWIRFRTSVTGSEPDGTSGKGYVSIRAYPGESPTWNGASGSRGAIHGCGTANSSSGYGRYTVVSGLTFVGPSSSASTDAGPINLQTGADYWRVFDNDITWPSTDSGSAHQKAGGIAGNGDPLKIMFNYVHDVSGGDASSLENHGIYLDGSNNCAANFEIAYNYITNVTTGTLIQCHNQSAGDLFTNGQVHNNWCENSGKYGLNFDSFQNIDAWNNVVIGSYRNGLRFNPNTNQTNVQFQAEFNTFYNCYKDTTGAYTAIVSQEASPGAKSGTNYIKVSHNLFVMPTTRSSSIDYVDDNGGFMTFDQNIYYDYKGVKTTKYSSDSNGSYDAHAPFVTEGSNYNLSSNSSARNVVTTTEVISGVALDFAFADRPLLGNAHKSAGAYEAT